MGGQGIRPGLPCLAMYRTVANSLPVLFRFVLLDGAFAGLWYGR